MAAPKDIKLLDAVQTTAPLASPSKTIGDFRFLGEYTLDVSGLTEDAPVSVYIETSVAGSRWDVIAAVEGLVSDGAVKIDVIGCQTLLRARIEYVGPAIAVSLAGISHQTYCDIAAVDRVIAQSSLEGLPLLAKAEGCLMATDEALSYLGVGYTFPLIAWGAALRMHTAKMALYHIMAARGFSVEADDTIRLGYTDAIAWLKSGALTDPSIVDSTPTQGPQTAYMVSRPSRGWDRF